MAVLAVVGAVNAAIAAAYYLRVIAVMYFGIAHRQHGGEGGWGAKSAMYIATGLVLLVGIFPSMLTTSTNQADHWLTRPPLEAAARVTQLAEPASTSALTPAR
jgi:NADH-quinone oxidoreductase subunit N